MNLGNVSSLSYQQIPVINSKAVVDDGRVSEQKKETKSENNIIIRQRIRVKTNSKVQLI